MPSKSLGEFLNRLEKAGELHRITAPVSCMLEITEITDRISKSPASQPSPHARTFDPHHAHLGGKALLFENVQTPQGKATMPLLINAGKKYPAALRVRYAKPAASITASNPPNA